MKQKKWYVILSMMMGLNVFASPESAQNDSQDVSKKSILEQAGIPASNPHEIKIVPSKKYLNESFIKESQDNHYYAQKLKEYIAMKEQQDKNGYVQSKETRARELIDLKHVAAYHQKKYADEYSQESTHIRQTIDELKMGYTFRGVPNELMDENIGYAPYGAYKSIAHGDGADGWDGAVQFFNVKGIGGCAFTEHNRVLSGFGVELIKEFVQNDVQNKPTIVLIKGSKETGFVYDVKWYDYSFTRDLECASKDFNSDIKEKIIALANRIEAYQH